MPTPSTPCRADPPKPSTSVSCRRRRPAPGSGGCARPSRYDDRMTDSHAAAGTPSTPAADGVHRVRVLLYSDDITTRDAVRAAAGRRPARDVEVVSWQECATAEAVIEAMDAGGIDVAVLDGEATPMGGLGLCRQLKNEIFRCPPGARAHRTPAGRVARGLVARRRRRSAPARPDRGRRGHLAPRSRAGRRRADLACPPRRPASPPGPTCCPPCCAGEDLPTDAARWAMDRDDGRRGDAGPARRASSWRCAPRARPSRRLRGLADVMLEHAHPHRGARAERSTSSAPAATGCTR